MIIIAFDPGGTTGFAEVNIQAGEEDILDVGEIGSAEQVWYFLNTRYPDQIVYELFFYQRRDKVDLTPVEVIGVIKLWAAVNKVPIAGYSAAQAKNFWTDQKMKKIGAWFPGMPHGTDALRHLLFHRVFAMKHDFILRGLRD